MEDFWIISMLNLLSLVGKLSQNSRGWPSARALLLPSIVHHAALSPTVFLIKLFLTEHSAQNPSEAVALAWFLLFSLFFPLFSHQGCQNISYALALWERHFDLDFLSFLIPRAISSQKHKFDWFLGNTLLYCRPFSSGQMKIWGDKHSGTRRMGCLWVCVSRMAWAPSPCTINNA